MILTISFEDRDYDYKIEWSKLAKILGVTEEQVIDAAREVLK